MTGSVVQRYLKQQRPIRSVEEEVFLALQILADRLMEPWATYLRERAELTPVQYNVLRILRGAGADGLLIGEIGRRLITRSPDVTRLIDRLERRGLVRRRSCPEDGRAVRVHITSAGRTLLTPLDRRADEMMRSCVGDASQRQLEQLRDQLGALLEVVVPLE